MKRILAVLILLLLCSCSVWARQTPINFVYIHGSDQGTVMEFENWINKMHPNMKKNISENLIVQKKLLNNAYIKTEPEMFYWADKPKLNKSFVQKSIELAKNLSWGLPQTARTLIAYTLHDAIWLQRHSNIKPILDNLNKIAIENDKNGENTVLVGYSAGTLITYQYFLEKGRYLNIDNYLSAHQKELNITDEQIKFAKKYIHKNTCIDALVDAKLGTLSADGGIVISNDEENRQNFVKNIDKQTELSCAPDNVIGTINFGSPVVVFYSNLGDENSQLRYFTNKMIQSIVENNKFFMTVNYTKDPIAVPIDNTTYAEMCKHKNIKNGGGFVYHTFVKGGFNVAVGHLRYWSSTNHFTKAVAKSFENGYNFFYKIN